MLDFIRQFRGMIFKKKDSSATPLTYSSTQEGAIYNNNNSEMRTQIGGEDRAVVTDTQAQTLTNKTLTSPVINSPTGIVKADVGLSNVDNTSDATKNAAIAALTNKTINADLNTVTNITTSNLKSGVLNVSSVLSGATDAQIPSAQAVKTYVDNAVASKDQASEISYSNSTSGLTATNVQDAIDEVDGNVDNLVTLSGVALDATNLGTFTGTTIPDNQTNKQAFQALETAHESHTGASSGVHGVVGSVVGTSDSQSLSNKTIVVANNTITTAASGNLAAVELNAALSELQGDIDTRATSTALSDHINNVSGAHAASAISNTPSGNLAATTVQAALNELQSDVDSRALSVGGSIQSPIRLDVKKDTKANLLTYAATASNGQLCFATDTKEMFQVLDGALVSVGSGGTSNVDALLTQTFDESALTDFTQTGLALIETNPMNGKKTARLIHQAATTQSFKYVKAVDPKYRGKNLTMSFQVRSSATAGNVTLNVYDETNAANLILSQAITLGSSTISATTNSNTTLSGISSSDINKLKVGETITGSGIPTGTTITAISISALTATISQAATASATVTLKNSDLPQKQSASFDVPNNCASLSYTISALAESGLPETYVDDVVITLTSAALTSTSVSIPTKDGQVVGSKKVELQGDTLFTGTIPADNTIPQITEGSQILTLSYTMKRAGNKLRIRSSAYVTEESNTGNNICMALFKDSDVNAIATNATGASDPASLQVGTIVIEKDITVSSASTVTISLRGGNDSGSFRVNKSKTLGTPDYGGTMITSLTVEEIQVGDYSEATTIPLTSAVFQTQPDSALDLQGYAGQGSTRTQVTRFTNLKQLVGDAITYTSSVANGVEVTVLRDGFYSISIGGSGLVSGGTAYGIGKNMTDFTTGFTARSANSDILDCIVGSNPSSGRDSTKSIWSGPLKAGDKIYPLSASTSEVPDQTFFHVAYAGSTKQINASSDQKIDLPSSELRMGAYAGCASTNTRVAKYGSVEKLVGDAFTIVNDPALGFSLTMKKSGFLSLSTLVSAAAGNYLSISRNATQFSTDPYAMTVGQNIMGGYNSDSVPMAWSGKCNVGDVFRVHVAAAAAAYVNGPNLGSGFNALFQEDKVQVSLSNVLPQFTQSDSAIRIDGANGYGSSGTRIRRFSNIRDNIGTAITYNANSDEATNGASFLIKESGNYQISYTDGFSSTGNLGITKNAPSLTTDIQNVPIANMLAWESAAYGSVSWSGYLEIGDVIRPHTNALGTGGFTASFSISKVGKPNLTSVDVTPFTNYKGVDTEFIQLSAGNGAGSTGIYCRRFATVDKNTNLGIIRYVDDAVNGAYFQVLKKCRANFSWTELTPGASSTFLGFTVNSTQVSTQLQLITDGYIAAAVTVNGPSATNGPNNVSANMDLNVGDIVRCQNTAAWKTDGLYNTSTQDLRTRLSITAVAEADQIVSPISSFSSDTASLVYAPSTSYTLSTLANAPVGTFITFTAAAGANTQTQTTTAPTQSVSDMNVNGIQITGRGFNQTSTAAAPAVIAIQIGKGFKGIQVNGYRTTGKTGIASLDNQNVGTNINTGLCLRDYNENTGVILIDAAIDRMGSSNNRYFITDTYNGNETQTTAYIVVNASKSPTLAAVPQLQPRVAYLSEVQPSGTQGGASVATTWTTRTLNTLVDNTGIVKSLASNTITLDAGTYAVRASSPQNSTNGHKCRIRNTTDGITLVVGETAYNSTSGSFNSPAILEGEFTLTSTKTIALQYYSVIAQGTNGLGIASSSGESEVYGRVILTKVK